MLLINVIALSLMAAGLLTAPGKAQYEPEPSDELEHWLAAALLNAAALALWNISSDPYTALMHWLPALAGLMALRVLWRALARHAPSPQRMGRLVPTACAALSLLWVRRQLS